MENDRNLKLIYIAGYGRSGTTLLDIALGQHASIIGAGEITALARHVWQNDEYCACGERVSSCAFWKPVVEKWCGREGDDRIFRYGRAQPKSEALFSLQRLASRVFPMRKFEDQLEMTGDLLREVAAASSAPIVLDSSKLPGRGALLRRVPGVDMYVVHVVRDGRGVAWSMMKPHRREVDRGIQKELKPKPLWYTAARWAVVNLAAELLKRKVGARKSVRVRYEDFVADPAATLNRIAALVGAEETHPYREGEPLRPQHQVAGSRHRMQKEIVLKGDDGWTQNMPIRKQVAFAVLCAPLLLWYGYPLRTPARASADIRLTREGKQAS